MIGHPHSSAARQLTNNGTAKLSNRSLKRLAEHVTGDAKLTKYRSGPVLVTLFNTFGCNDLYGPGFPARWKFAEDRLRDLNGNDALHRLIEAVFDPLEFLGVLVDDAPVSKTAAIADMNQYLARDGLRIDIDNRGAHVRTTAAGSVTLQLRSTRSPLQRRSNSSRNRSTSVKRSWPTAIPPAPLLTLDPSAKTSSATSNTNEMRPRQPLPATCPNCISGCANCSSSTPTVSSRAPRCSSSSQASPPQLRATRTKTLNPRPNNELSDKQCSVTESLVFAYLPGEINESTATRKHFPRKFPKLGTSAIGPLRVDRWDGSTLRRRNRRTRRD